MTAVENVFEQLEEQGIVFKSANNLLHISISASDYLDIKRLAKQMEKQQIIDAFESGEDNVDNDGCTISKNGVESYFIETYGSKGSDDHIVDTNEMVDHVPDVREMVSSQTEISDEEIEKGADYYGDRWIDAREAFYGFLEGAKWYREQLKSK